MANPKIAVQRFLNLRWKKIFYYHYNINQSSL